MTNAAPMNACHHESLHIDGQVFSIKAADGEPTAIRAAHVKVHCRGCGMPFRFMGEIRDPPTDPLDFILGGAPWVSAAGDELASWITPLDAPQLLSMEPEGRA